MNPRDEAASKVSSEHTPIDQLSRWLIQRAARSSPAALSERLEEEWLADLAAQRGEISRLRFALGCCWATRAIANDFLASATQTIGTATANGTLLVGHYGPSRLPGRATVFIFIVGLHALVIYGFATGLAQKVMQAIPLPMQTTIVTQPRMHELAPPIIQYRLDASRPILPQVAPSFEFPSDVVKNPIDTSPSRMTPPPTQPQAVTHVTRIVGGPGPGFPNTDDYYPLTSRRLGEVGVTTVRVCVDRGGRLASAPSIAKTSGFPRLDDGAIRLARAGSGHYRSTTEDGMPVTFCYPYRIRFRIQN